MVAISYGDVKELALELYDVDKRPSLVATALRKAGAESALSKIGILNGSAEKVVDTVAAMTTVAGLLEKKDVALEIAAPYIAKAKDADGRKELAEEVLAAQIAVVGKAKFNEKVVEPVSAKINAGKEIAAPYVASAKEYADPYVAKLAELRNSERVESMIAAFQSAREHPADKVGELRAKAVDLIRYENLRSYRDHVMSAEFQADTIQLVKVDLPAIASAAAKKGADGVKAKATMMKEAMDKYSEKLGSLVPSEVELRSIAEKLKLSGAALLAELQSELNSGYDHVKSEGFSMDDAMERLKRVVSIVDNMVVTPIIASVKAEAPAGSAADERPLPPTGDADEDEPMQVLTPIIASVKAEAPAGSAADERPLLRTGVADEDEPMQDALEEAVRPAAAGPARGAPRALAAVAVVSTVTLAISLSAAAAGDVQMVAGGVGAADLLAPAS